MAMIIPTEFMCGAIDFNSDGICFLASNHMSPHAWMPSIEILATTSPEELTKVVLDKREQKLKEDLDE